VTAFEPANGDKPRWKILYDMVLARVPGDTIDYHTAMNLCETTDRAVVLSAMREAMQRLEENRLQSVRNLRGKGWVVMQANEHLAASLTHTRRAVGQHKAAFRKIDAISDRRDELDREERLAADLQRRTTFQMMQLARKRELSPEDIFREVGKDSGKVDWT
jgi:hypothetical protein